MQKKNIIYIGIITLALLLIPLIAMQVSNEISWSLFDFIIAGILIFCAGLLYDFVSRRSGAMTYRIALAIASVSALALFWINGAVGIIGNEENPANLMYLGVIAIGLIGSTLSRLKPDGMARTLFVVAIAQALVPPISLTIWQPQNISWGIQGVLGVFILNSFFVVLFVISGLLFRKARNQNL